MSCVRATADRVVLLIDGKSYCEGAVRELTALNDENVNAFFEILP
jgi:phospholipid/cholesterol/gamma-HCH transport system ATP-binding protein